MPDRVAPIVPLIFPCEFATLDLADEKWQLKQPLHFVRLPDDKSFPFRVDEFWLYAQLMYGLGEFNLSVQLIEQESGIIVGRSEVIQRLFDARNRCGKPSKRCFDCGEWSFHEAAFMSCA